MQGEWQKLLLLLCRNDYVMSIINTKEREYLLTSMENLLQEYDYDYTKTALNKIINTWETSKSSLINAFKKHPNYIDGKFMIVFNHEYHREFDEKGIGAFSQWLIDYVIPDYKVNNPIEIQEQTNREGCWWLPNALFKFLIHLEEWITSRTIDDNTAAHINEMIPSIRGHSGEKSSRVINRICTYLGYHLHPY
jgi:hypothetical protein